MRTTHLKGYPVVDAKEKLNLYPTPEDSRNGVPGEANACALAKYCERAMGSPCAVIGKARAFVVLPDKKGRMCAVRHEVPSHTREAIKRFDKTGEMPRQGFELRPMRASETREGKREKNQRLGRTSNRRRPQTGNRSQGVWVRTMYPGDFGGIR